MAFARTIAFVLSFAFLATLTPSAKADIRSADRRTIETIVHEYLVKNPEVLVEAMNALRAKQQAAADAKRSAVLAHMNASAAKTTSSPVIGNAKGDVTIIEFFDYQCSYCKKVLPNVQKVLDNDSNVRVVMKEFPILGPASAEAARYALAVWLVAPKKYMDFHQKLMAVSGRLSSNKITTLLDETGVDTAAVKKALNNPAINAEIQANIQLAQSLDISGTPAFIVGNEVAPGFLNADELAELVKKARKAK